jgi:multidrug efflux pump subunit AcrA (membrane-fusion protein)
MNARKSWILAFLLSVVGIVAFVYISKMKQPPKQAVKKGTVIAPFFTITNGSSPLIISGSGQVRAKNRIDLFSEVNGVLLPQQKDFRAGMGFDKGQVLVSIDATEQKANLFAQRSEYQNLITALMPDIKLEFPNEVPKWEHYLNNIQINKTIPEIPTVSSDKEKYFITGRKVYSTYYNIQNLEARLDKYTLIAPFSGVVTESLINPGGLVRAGQKLGSFSNLGLFEIEVSIPAEDAQYIKVDNQAALVLNGQAGLWQGKVARINPAINLNTQTVSVFIESNSAGLREGMFPTANISCGDIEGVVEIPRNLLINNEWIYYIDRDSTLQRKEVKPIRFQDKTVITNRLENGTKVLAKNIPGSFIGMKVIPVKEQ